ncbi:MAG: PilZ domain-containing protein [SAR324 cluster bacterium]|nr:PilZ domain-containing protein [SAR324 cluster bacterium]
MTKETKHRQEISVFAKRLSGNAVVMVQKTQPYDDQRHTGILIGNIKDESLIIGGFDPIQFSIGEIIILRMAQDNHLVGFETEVVEKHSNPLIYIVKFPLKIESLNLRKSYRVQAFFPGDIYISEKESGPEEILILKTRILDISKGGCSCSTKTKLQADFDVKISFTLPGEQRIQSIKGVVIDSIATGNVYDSRIKFIQEDSDLPIIEEISRWVNDSIGFASDVGILHARRK